MKLNQLQPALPPSGPECPRSVEWPRVAAGAVSFEASQDFLRHAAQCDHCGPLVKTTGTLDDAFTVEEEAAIAKLESRLPDRRDFSRRLSALSQAPTANPPLLSHGKKRALAWPVWVYGAAAAAVVAAALTLFLWLRPESPDQLLAEAYSQQRTLTLRFSGAKYGPVRVLRGDSARSSLNEPQSLLDAKALIHSHLTREPGNPQWLDAKGRVDLLEANYEAAIQTFQRALDVEPNSPVLLVDTASAYFERAEIADRANDYSQAIEFLSRELAQNPGDPIALYNRALVNEKMFLFHQALEDWDRYLSIDAKGDWAEEARRHRDAVRQKIEQQKSGAAEPLLNPAEFVHQVNLNREQFVEADRRAEDYLDVAIREWLATAFRESGTAEHSSLAALQTLGGLLSQRHRDRWLRDFLKSPPSPTQFAAVQKLLAAAQANLTGDYVLAQDTSTRAKQLFMLSGNVAGALRARFETLYALQRSNRTNEHCIREGNSMAGLLRERHYEWLESQLFMERSLCMTQMGRFHEAQQDLDNALTACEKSNYQTLYLRALGMVAGLHRGESTVYSVDRQGLSRYWNGTYPPARAFQFYSDMAFASEDAARWNMALAAAKDAVNAISLAKQPLIEGLARYQLARYALIAGDRALADSESNRAGMLLGSLPQNEVTRGYEVNQEIRLAKLEAERSNLAQASLHLARAQLWLPSIRHYFTTLRFYNALGEIQLLQGHRAEAEKALLSAIAIARQGLSSQQDERERADWLAATGEAYRRLAQLRWESQDFKGALNIWEWYRDSSIQMASPYNASSTAVNPESVSAVPPGEEVTSALAALTSETVVSYLELPKALVIWAFDDRGMTAQPAGSSLQEIEKLARRFHEECARRDSDPAMLRKDAQQLYTLLIAPVADHLSPQRKLIIEAAGVVGEIPFVALLDPAGRYLAETYAIVLSPGLLYQRRLRTNQSFSRHQRALVVGPPPLVGSLAANLQPLEDADEEARDIASRFETRILLTGSQASMERVQQAIPQAAIFHFAGHAIEHQGRPALLLAGARPSGETTVFDTGLLQAQALGRLQLAVLSACSTAKTEQQQTGNPETLVRPFLRAGVPDVVATRWSVDSAATASFMRLFYTHLLGGQPVSSAMQMARAEMRRSAGTAHPYYWAAFEVYGR